MHTHAIWVAVADIRGAIMKIVIGIGEAAGQDIEEMKATVTVKPNAVMADILTGSIMIIIVIAIIDYKASVTIHQI
jgi:hypothetical protein